MKIDYRWNILQNTIATYYNNIMIVQVDENTKRHCHCRGTRNTCTLTSSERHTIRLVSSHRGFYMDGYLCFGPHHKRGWYHIVCLTQRPRGPFSDRAPGTSAPFYRSYGRYGENVGQKLPLSCCRYRFPMKMSFLFSGKIK